MARTKDTDLQLITDEQHGLHKNSLTLKIPLYAPDNNYTSMPGWRLSKPKYLNKLPHKSSMHYLVVIITKWMDIIRAGLKDRQSRQLPKTPKQRGPLSSKVRVTGFHLTKQPKSCHCKFLL